MTRYLLPILFLVLASGLFADAERPYIRFDRINQAAPTTTDNAIVTYSGTAVATDQKPDHFKVQDTAWTISDAELMTAGGTLALGSQSVTQTSSNTVYIPAHQFGLGGAADPSVELKNDKFTYAFADATADDVVYITWDFPDDFFEGTSHVDVQVDYLCDQGSPTEGEWALSYLAVGDDDADAALTTGLTVLDTPAAQNDWNRTAPMYVPFGAITTSDDLLVLKLAHSVADPFCGGNAVNVLGVKLTYTTDVMR